LEKFNVSFSVEGFGHEKSRLDRDSYVSINWANIDPSKFE
jgi:hypothetical protein